MGKYYIAVWKACSLVFILVEKILNEYSSITSTPSTTLTQLVVFVRSMWKLVEEMCRTKIIYIIIRKDIRNIFLKLTIVSK